MSNTSKKQSEQNGKQFLQNAFALQQNLVAEQLKFAQTITHNGVLGAVKENIFISTLRSYLPNRYAVNSGIIIDSQGKTSDQIDIIIYDSQFTPNLLTQDGHRYIPAESIYAIFEVKSTVNSETLTYAMKKAMSVRSLHRTSIDIAHAGGKYSAKPPLHILAGIICNITEWNLDNTHKHIHKKMSKAKDNHLLDCGLILSGGSFDYFAPNASDKLRLYQRDTNSPDHPIPEINWKQKNDNLLIYFIFNLLKRLQASATVAAIDWDAYIQQLTE